MNSFFLSLVKIIQVYAVVIPVEMEEYAKLLEKVTVANVYQDIPASSVKVNINVPAASCSVNLKYTAYAYI